MDTINKKICFISVQYYGDAFAPPHMKGTYCSAAEQNGQVALRQWKEIVSYPNINLNRFILMLVMLNFAVLLPTASVPSPVMRIVAFPLLMLPM